MSDVRLDGDGRELLDQLFDKWSLLTLAALCERPRRFTELRNEVTGVTPKSLTACLRRLERNGMVKRVVLSTQPVAIEYRITTLGRTLRSPVHFILEWALDHLDLVESARQQYDRIHPANSQVPHSDS